jgi:tRNA pseudouridine38-40 synthase
MYRYKLIVAYDGTGYHGWQVQNDKKTIAQTLQDTFARIFSQQIVVVGVSRTDAGVHAHGQVATFVTDKPFDRTRMKYAWNNLLPASMAIVALEPVPITYNPFYDIAYKTYWYYIFVERPSPFVSRYGWHIRTGICLKKLNQALQFFVGTHDFRSFATDDTRGEDTIRSIDSIDVEYDQQMRAYKIIIVGQKFLRHMIRRIVGAAVEVALRPELSVERVQNMLNNQHMSTLVSAPPHGLVLHNIVYHSKDEK